MSRMLHRGPEEFLILPSLFITYGWNMGLVLTGVAGSDEEGSFTLGLSWTVLPVVGILTKKPDLALSSGSHPSQRSTMLYHYQM